MTDSSAPLPDSSRDPDSRQADRTATRAGDRPIIFSSPMVRAILDGRKTQTRRVVKWNKPATGLNLQYSGLEAWHWCSGAPQYGWALYDSTGAQTMATPCPYGIVGDHLWVREAFCVGYEHERGQFTAFRFQGCDDKRRAFYRATDDDAPDDPRRPWKPSIHMPRWASRITLEITDVRVRRLWEISGTDILAEGAVLRAHDDQFGHNPVSAFDGKVYLDLRTLWAAGWDSINAKRAPWSSNPWVWALTFKRIANA